MILFWEYSSQKFNKYTEYLMNFAHYFIAPPENTPLCAHGLYPYMGVTPPPQSICNKVIDASVSILNAFVSPRSFVFSKVIDVSISVLNVSLSVRLSMLTCHYQMYLFKQGQQCICITKVIKCLSIGKFLTLIRSWSKLRLKEALLCFHNLVLSLQLKPSFWLHASPKKNGLLNGVYTNTEPFYIHSIVHHSLCLVNECRWCTISWEDTQTFPCHKVCDLETCGYLGLFQNQSNLWVNWCCGANSQDEDWPQKLTDIIAVLQGWLIQYLKVSQDTESVFDHSL